MMGVQQHGIIGGDYFMRILQVGQSATNVYPDLCNILRPAFGSDDYGGSASTYSSVAVDVPCNWVAKTGASERVIAERLSAVVPYEITMAETVDVKPADRVLIAARGIEPARTFEVKAVVFSPSSEMKVQAVFEN